MSIRQARREDEPEVLALARLFLETTSYRVFQARNEDKVYEQLHALFDLVLEHGVCLVSEGTVVLRGRPVLDGFIAIVIVPNLISGVIYAEEVAWFVAPDSRGGLIARRLWLAAEEWSRQHGAAAIKMVAPADEPTVGRIYERAGYRAIETSYHKRL